MIGEAQSLGDRKRKAGGVKEMLQDATKLAHKLHFLVEEVGDSACVCVSVCVCVCVCACVCVHVSFLCTSCRLCVPCTS